MALGKNNNRSKRKRNNAKLKNKDKLAVYTYPSLHDDVLEAIGGTISPTPYFNETEDDGTSIREYDTNIMGRFQCSDQNWYGLLFRPPSHICVPGGVVALLTIQFGAARNPDGAAESSPFTSGSSMIIPTTPTCSANAASDATSWES
jgi:hypothetical protein